MRLRFMFLFVTILLLLSLTVSADNYTNIGNNNDYRFEGNNFFNAQLPEFETFTRPIDTNFVPLVADLDGDGVVEIIVFDGDDIAIYNFSSILGLNLLDSLDTDLDSNKHMFMMTQDIDNDGFLEILAVSDGSSVLEIFEFNTTGILRRQDQHSIAGSGSGERLISCNSDNLCVVVRTVTEVTGSDDILLANFFNATDISINNYIIESAQGESGTSLLCLPRIRNIEVADVDGDGLEDFTISYGKLRNTPSVNEEFRVARFTGTHSNLSFDTSPIITDVQTQSDLSAGTTCRDINGFMSSPLVMNVNGGGDLETVMGVAVTTTQYIMFSVSTDGDKERFPNLILGESDGQIISNPFRMNAFEDSPNTANPSAVDFCILGHDATESKIDLLCGSKRRQSSLSADSRDYDFDLLDGMILPDPNSFDYSSMAHSGEFTSVKGEGIDVNLDELVSSYGIFRLNNPSLGFDFMDLQFQNELTNATVIMADILQNGRNEMVMCTDTALAVTTDSFVNKRARIVDPVSIKPCPAQTWKLSTENDTNFLFVSFTVDDPDGDDVSARATLYADELINKTTNFTDNFTAGTPFDFRFEINETTTSSILRFEGRDTENPELIDVVEYQFNVATEGITSKDCTFKPILGDINDIINQETAQQREERLSREAEFENDLKGSLTNNSIRQFFGLGTELTGIGITTLWVLFMAFGLFLLVTRTDLDSTTTATVSILFLGVMTVAGTLLGFFGVGLLISLLILGILALVIFMSKRLVGGGN